MVISSAMIYVEDIKTKSRSSSPEPAASSDPPDICGAWLGYERHSLNPYRLVFDEGGRGTCIVFHARNEVGLSTVYASGIYAIEGWHIRGSDLTFKIRPVTEAFYAIQMTSPYASRSVIKLDVMDGRMMHATLRRESEILKLIGESKRYAENRSLLAK